jgi:site-specific recombinase XerD
VAGHAFAVHRLVSWYQQGADVQRLLPQLATYLGHLHIAATQRYLTMRRNCCRKPAGASNATPGGNTMSDRALLGVWFRRFLLEHLTNERNLARNTQRSYRDTLLLLLPFATEKLSKPVDRLTVVDLSADLIRAFLSHPEQSQRCAVTTRNQRLAAIHALARFVGEHSPEHIAWCSQIRLIPFKKSTRSVVCYLEKPEIDALLDAPDRSTAQGRRDHALLLFLYNAGTRAEEAAQLHIV